MTALAKLDVLVVRARIPAGRLPLTEEQVQPRRQDPVDDPDEERDHEHGDEHHGGIGLQLLAIEPGHLGELDPDFLDEFPKPLHPGHPPTSFIVMAGVEGFEPPTPGFGDRCSSRTELHACRPTAAARADPRLARLLVDRMLATRRAELAELDPVRMEPLVL